MNTPVVDNVNFTKVLEIMPKEKVWIPISVIAVAYSIDFIIKSVSANNCPLHFKVGNLVEVDLGESRESIVQ